MPALNPTPKHPSRIHTAQKTSSTASAFRPKRLQKAVSHDGHQQLVAFADDDPGSITGRVKVGEIKNSTIGIPATIGSKVCHGEFGWKMTGSILRSVYGEFVQFISVDIRGRQESLEKKIMTVGIFVFFSFFDIFKKPKNRFLHEKKVANFFFSFFRTVLYYIHYVRFSQYYWHFEILNRKTGY